MSTPTERRYRREARYSKQLRVTVEPATAAALEAEADVTHTSVSAVIRDALAARRIPRRGSEWPFRKQERSEVISENPIMENTLEPSRPGAIAAAPPTNWQPVQRIRSIPSMDL